MTVVVPLSAFLITMFLSHDSSFRAFCSPCDRLSFGLLNLILASSNLTSRKVSEQLRTGLVGPSLTEHGKDEVLYLYREICI